MFEILLSGSITTTILVGLFVGLFVYWLIQRFKYNYPPGPRGLPILGNLLQLDQKTLYEQVLKWSKQYGPVVTLNFGHVTMLFVNEIDVALEVLVKKSTDFANRMVSPSVEAFTKYGKDIAFSNYGPTWKLHRRIASKGLRHYMQGNALEKRINDATSTVFEVIDEINCEFDPQEYVNFLVGNILTGLCFGGKYSFDDKDLEYILKKDDEFLEVFGVGAPEDFIPGLKYVYKTNQLRKIEGFSAEIVDDYLMNKYLAEKKTYNKDNIRHFTDTLLLARQEAIEEEGQIVADSLTEDRTVQTLIDIFFVLLIVDNIRHFTDTLILARQEAIEEEGQIVADSLTEDRTVQTLTDKFFVLLIVDNIRHFTDTLLLARQEAIEEEGQVVADSLTEDHLVQTLSDIFFGGIDTSRLTLYWAIKHMIAFPDIQEKVQAEIDSVVGKDRMPGLADRPNLGYTEAVLHESMRLSSVVPLGIFHVSSCDTELAGYRIPKGTVVGINHWALHNDPDAWEDVDRFIPERYLDENGKLGPKPKNWLPFSAGKRVCLGEFVAKPELHLIFAQLMQRYKWKMVTGKCADLTADGSIFARLATPYKVIVERRI